ncbi:hypothetical protein M422DRAFT_242414 [Sphaerobolus stellatus SS14]|nr:hypothetical protein M422DRAFT_242414 [Sphaerobolus stellatus SS14]
MPKAERDYVTLLYEVCSKYANWDPDKNYDCGDYGRITRGRPAWQFWRGQEGVFVPEGNIYTEGLAQKYGIPMWKETSDREDLGLVDGAREQTAGGYWLRSHNMSIVELSVEGGIGSQILGDLAGCEGKAAYRVSRGDGAFLAMQDHTLFHIPVEGLLLDLLKEKKMKGKVIVTEVIRTSAYARNLMHKSDRTFAVGWKVSAGVPPHSTRIGGDGKWVSDSNSNNFKNKVHPKKIQSYCPLFKLVSLYETEITQGLREEIDANSNNELVLVKLPASPLPRNWKKEMPQRKWQSFLAKPKLLP